MGDGPPARVRGLVPPGWEGEEEEEEEEAENEEEEEEEAEEEKEEEEEDLSVTDLLSKSTIPGSLGSLGGSGARNILLAPHYLSSSDFKKIKFSKLSSRDWSKDCTTAHCKEPRP